MCSEASTGLGQEEHRLSAPGLWSAPSLTCSCCWCVHNHTPRRRQWDGMYVLYTYAARRQTARAVQLHLSNPEAGREDDVLRHITFCRM